MKIITSPRALLGLALFAACGLAQAEVVVVVSAKSDVGALSSAQVSQIFLAKSVSFPGGGTAMPVDQNEGAAVRNEFYTKVTGKDAAQLKAYWSQLLFTGKAQRPQKGADSEAVKKMVASKPGAIGYIEKSAVDASVKVVLTP